jgi:prevent-host-death family protein
MKISDVKNALANLVDAVSRKETRVLIEKRGTPVAALVSPADLERLLHIERERETTTRAMERISEAFADVPVEELEAKIDEVIAAERAREARFAVIDRMREAFADVPPEEIEREAERTVAEARERIRQRTPEPAARSA